VPIRAQRRETLRHAFINQSISNFTVFLTFGIERDSSAA
jgi:hypothetical protein